MAVRNPSDVPPSDLELAPSAFAVGVPPKKLLKIHRRSGLVRLEEGATERDHRIQGRSYAVMTPYSYGPI